MHGLVAVLLILAAYFIGAIPFGYLVARRRGLNILEHGSGNIGATNVGRLLGWRFGILVFGLDFAKGAIPVLAVLLVKGHCAEEYWTRGFVEVAAGLTAFLGHLFPIYLKFHGGKGVATGTGVVAVLLPVPTLAGLFVWLVVVCASRYVSLASIAAVFVLCAVHLRETQFRDWLEPRTLFCLVAGGLVLVRHYANIGRLFKGTENQIKGNIVMLQTTKCLHVLALGLWFGMSVFFTFVVAFALFGAFESLAQQEKRETWFPRPLMYDEADDDVNGPKEQGTRAAGFAIAPMFDRYFALQGLCGFVALATALSWSGTKGPIQRWRVNLLLLAVGFVIVGWFVERRVDRIRPRRDGTTEAHLRDVKNEVMAAEMKEARAEFGLWHGMSMALNLGAILCVAGAMALGGNLPGHPLLPSPPKETAEKPELTQDGAYQSDSHGIQQMGR